MMTICSIQNWLVLEQGWLHRRLMNLGVFLWSVWVITPRYPDTEPLPERVLINPVIKSIGNELIAGWEGCLSVPGLRGEVMRWKRIHLKWQDQEGAFHTEELQDFYARVVQHEKDHLDGVLFPDRLTNPLAFGFTDELQADGRIT